MLNLTGLGGERYMRVSSAFYAPPADSISASSDIHSNGHLPQTAQLESKHLAPLDSMTYQFKK